ncbi:hypothetical protein M0R04_09805 [Candidatus Dojkabacteria bacterium]|jgi:hypothetical protein|nr:hypothetical protein [Candidatus Dojkabacteria bacterium]
MVARLLLTGIFALLLVGALVPALEITQIYTLDKKTLTQELQSIVTDKSTYTKGQVAKIEDFQDINAYCQMLQGQFKLKSGSSVLESKSFTLGTAGYMTAFYELSQDTTNLNAGTYTIESRWFCDGQELGQDGYIDSNKDPSISTFKVTSPSGGGDPPVQTCSKQCNIGYKLINPSSADCYCEQQYTLDNGVCELGEPVASRDCEEKLTCQENQIKLDGLCVDPDRICIKDGGNADCAGEAPLVSINMIIYGIGVVIVLIGGILVMFSKDGK